METEPPPKKTIKTAAAAAAAVKRNKHRLQKADSFRKRKTR
jgi:hypothetical protein